MKKDVKKAILKILISGGLILFVLSKIDRQSLLENFKLLNIYYVPLIIGLIALNWVIGAIRWKLLLLGEESKNISFGYLLKLYFIGSFFNNFMPTSIGGDVYKVYVLGKKIGDNHKAFSATFMERFTGVVALVLISYFGLIRSLDFWVAQFPDSLPEFAIKAVLFGGFWILVAAGFLSLKILGKKFDLFKKVYESLIEYKNHKEILFSAFLTSFAVQLAVIFSQYFVFTALGVNLPVLLALFVFPVVNLAAFFIPSLNGIGVQDALFIYFFTGIGVTAEMALGASLLYHLFRLATSLIGGIVYAIDKNN